MSAIPTTSPRVVLADLLPGSRSAVRDIALVATGTAFMSAMAQIAILVPPSPVPITGQTLAVGLIGATLGFRRGLAAMLLYVLAGLFLPVFSDGGSGWDVITGAGGGYIFGFVVATAVIGLLAERGADRKVQTAFISFVALQLIVFGFGLIGFKLATDQDWSYVIHNGFTIFIVGGIVKAVLGALILPGAWRATRKLDA